MKKHKIFGISIITVLLFCSVSSAANWVVFFKSAAQLDFFYDKDSIAYTHVNTVLVWQKIIPQKDAAFKPWIEASELREVDCQRRRYKTLQGKRIYENKPMEIKKATSWIYLEPDDLDTAYYKTICIEQK